MKPSYKPVNLAKKYGNVATILGGQWGDEGKGKLIDIMSEEYDIVARATGGANAGHTVYVPDEKNPENTRKFVFHLLPSGILYPHIQAVIGNGCVVHLPTLFREIDVLKKNGINVDGRLKLSDRAHLVLEYHKEIDALQEEMKGKNAVGTTKRGIGPAYMDKIGRMGIRVQDLLDFHKFETKVRGNVQFLEKMYGKIGSENSGAESGEKYDVEKELEWYRDNLPAIKALVADTALLLNKAVEDGKKILMEGANGALLDVDHGTYPFVTSSNASVGGIITGTGVGATKLTSVIGVMKAYSTRVGAGPFPTELENNLGDKMRQNGGEFGSTTGRPRRCGWFDAVASRYSVVVNGLTGINLTKLDVLDDFETLKIATAYLYKGEIIASTPAETNDTNSPQAPSVPQTSSLFPASADVLSEVEVQYIELPGWKQKTSGAKKISDLPKEAQDYVKKLQELLGCPIDSVGVGISRDHMAWQT